MAWSNRPVGPATARLVQLEASQLQVSPGLKHVPLKPVKRIVSPRASSYTIALLDWGSPVAGSVHAIGSACAETEERKPTTKRVARDPFSRSPHARLGEPRGRRKRTRVSSGAITAALPSESHSG